MSFELLTTIQMTKYVIRATDSNPDYKDVITVTDSNPDDQGYHYSY